MSNQYSYILERTPKQSYSVPKLSATLSNGYPIKTNSKGASQTKYEKCQRMMFENKSLKFDVPAASISKSKGRGRVKLDLNLISNKTRRFSCFCKRKSGLMKKAHELSVLTGAQVMLLVASETGHVYTFATEKLQPMINSDNAKDLIKACLTTPDNNHTYVTSTNPPELHHVIEDFTRSPRASSFEDQSHSQLSSDVIVQTSIEIPHMNGE